MSSTRGVVVSERRDGDIRDDALEATPSVDEPRAPHRTEAWIDAFESQLTERLVDRVRRFARVRALNVAAAGRKVDDYYVLELVQDAIGDTWLGRLTWEPDRVSLESHLLRAIQCRTRHHRQQAAAFPHDTFEDVEKGSAATDVALYAKEVLSQIAERLGTDVDARRVLEAMCAGARTKADIIELANMSASTYHAAQVRLRRFIRGLTNEMLAERTRA